MLLFSLFFLIVVGSWQVAYTRGIITVWFLLFVITVLIFPAKYSPLYVFLFIFHLNLLGRISCFLKNCLLSSVCIWEKWREVFWLVMEVVSFWWMLSWNCSSFLCHARCKKFIVLLFSFSVVNILVLHCWSSLLCHLYWWGYRHRWSPLNLKYATILYCCCIWKMSLSSRYCR
jgi:hypothetical protein